MKLGELLEQLQDHELDIENAEVDFDRDGYLIVRPSMYWPDSPEKIINMRDSSMSNIKKFDSIVAANNCISNLFAMGENRWSYAIVQDPLTMLYQIDCNILKHVREDGTIQ